MGDRIKTAIEIAMEKAASLEDLSPEEKEVMKSRKKLEPLMKEFYNGEISPDEFWQKLKGNNTVMLSEAQLNLIDSIKFGIADAEFQKRKKGILAIETLKEEKNTPSIEQGLNLIESLQKKAELEKEQVYLNFKKVIEKNPQARMRSIEQGDATVVVKLSVEEAINQNPQWKQFLMEHQKNCSQEFARIVDGLKKELF